MYPGGSSKLSLNQVAAVRNAIKATYDARVAALKETQAKQTERLLAADTWERVKMYQATIRSIEDEIGILTRFYNSLVNTGLEIE